MTTAEPSGQSTFSPKIRDQSLVRKFIAQNGRGYTAIDITDGTASVDPDPDSLTLAVYFQDVLAQFPVAPPGTLVTTVPSTGITRDGTGLYHYDLGPEVTAFRGVLTLKWTYTINSVGFVYMDFAQVLGQMSFYDQLNTQEQSTIEQVTWMFADAFDSTEGGPQLIEPFQTHWDYERIAQMQRLAVIRFNFMSNFNNPPTTYGVGPGQQTVPAQYAGLMVLGTYLEVVRHLMRSYVEIPAFPGTDVTYTDRRDYLQRWDQIFQEEWPEYKANVRAAKIGLLNLSRGSLLVGGGIYGGNALGLFQAGTYASQVRSWRFYPAAPAISWGATAH